MRFIIFNSLLAWDSIHVKILLGCVSKTEENEGVCGYVAPGIKKQKKEKKNKIKMRLGL